jgi:hypothetical protein
LYTVFVYIENYWGFFLHNWVYICNVRQNPTFSPKLLSKDSKIERNFAIWENITSSIFFKNLIFYNFSNYSSKNWLFLTTYIPMIRSFLSIIGCNLRQNRRFFIHLFKIIILVPDCTRFGRIFAHWVIIYFGKLFENYKSIPNFGAVH